MVSILHNPPSSRTPVAVCINKGTCHDLVKYMSKEEGRWEKCQGFFSETEDMMSAIQAEKLIDGNTQGLHKGEGKFYMLTLNPSDFELIRMPSG